MSHPTNGAHNAKAAGRIKWDEVIYMWRLAHPKEQRALPEHHSLSMCGLMQVSCPPSEAGCSMAERLECCQCHTALQGGAGRQTEASGCQNYSPATVYICVSSGLWMPADRVEAKLLEHGQGRRNLGVHSGNFWELFVPIPGKHSYMDFQSSSRL